MQLTKISITTGKSNTMEIPISEKQYDAWLNSDRLVQEAFPFLTIDQLEFLISGMTPSEWDDLFADEDSE